MAAGTRLSGAAIDGVCESYRAGAAHWEGGILPARTCLRCKGAIRVETLATTYEARLKAILQRRPPQEPALPAQCPACHGTGAIDALREVEIVRRRAERVGVAAGILSEYAMGAAGEAEGPRGARCLRLVAHALRAHLQDWDAAPERGRLTDLGAAEG